MTTEDARGRGILVAAGRGAVAGLLGVAVMTAAEKVEQQVTRRPNSYVPARALLTLVGRRPTADASGRRPTADASGRRPMSDATPPVWNHVMHWGTGAALGALRGVWAVTGMRGPRANLAHTVVRLAVDQTIENATGVGAPPHTWPPREQVVDVMHKAAYSLATGFLADRLVPPRLQVRQGVTSH